jgi:hypothetical protein
MGILLHVLFNASLVVFFSELYFLFELPPIIGILLLFLHMYDRFNNTQVIPLFKNIPQVTNYALIHECAWLLSEHNE